MDFYSLFTRVTYYDTTYAPLFDVQPEYVCLLALMEIEEEINSQKATRNDRSVTHEHPYFQVFHVFILPQCFHFTSTHL
jgi:hypothetical protein